ncbi:MAG: FKBP-type peptidyl-prolyl cis-trans isomerase [Candidatus Saccharimonas sp.]
MATTKFQRWGILTILIVTVVGTIGSFAVMILATKNQASDTSAQQTALTKYQADYKAYQTKVDAQAVELSAMYYATFAPYASQVGSFDRDSVKDLVKNDLVVGTGEEVTGATVFAAYYIGWNPKGKIFDQSIDTTTNQLKAPLAISTGLDNASLIDGWKEGMKGMKIGGIRLLTIPSDKAYKDTAQSDDIPANTPLKFVVMAISAPETIAQPAIPPELLTSGS